MDDPANQVERIKADELVTAGLEAMRLSGMPLGPRLPGTGKAKIHQLPDGKTVRIRTSNDPILIVVADGPDEGAQLNIEGTDFLLLVMPSRVRSYGPINAFLIPSDVAELAVRTSHREWLETQPNTKGDNTTWNLWFGDRGKSSLPDSAWGYSKKWAKYKLKAEVSVIAVGVSTLVEGDKAPTQRRRTLSIAIEEARKMISEAAGVPPERVNITIAF